MYHLYSCNICKYPLEFYWWKSGKKCSTLNDYKNVVINDNYADYDGEFEVAGNICDECVKNL